MRKFRRRTWTPQPAGAQRTSTKPPERRWRLQAHASPSVSAPHKPRPLSSRWPWERPLQRAPERTRVSLRAERPPTEGIVPAPYSWDDLLEGGSPRAFPPAPPAYCAPGPDLFEGGLRIELALLVTAAPGGPVLEDRVCVTGRALATAIERERERVGTMVEDASERSATLRRRHMRRARDLRSRGGVPALLGLALAWAARLVHHVSEGALRGVRGLTRGVISFPDRIRAGLERASSYLATPTGRRRFLEGLKDPRNISAQQKAVTIFATLGGFVIALVLLHGAVTLAIPQHAVAWRRMFLLFVYSFTTSLGPPLPLEPVLLGASLYVGRPVALVTVLLAKVTAAYLIFFLGDEVHDKLREQSVRKPWLAKVLDWSTRFAQRFGVVALATFIAVPGLPDVIALYVFGTLQMTLRGYLLGVLIGSFLLNAFILYGVGSLLGLH